VVDFFLEGDISKLQMIFGTLGPIYIIFQDVVACATANIPEALNLLYCMVRSVPLVIFRLWTTNIVDAGGIYRKPMAQCYRIS